MLDAKDSKIHSISQQYIYINIYIKHVCDVYEGFKAKTMCSEWKLDFVWPFWSSIWQYKSWFPIPKTDTKELLLHDSQKQLLDKMILCFSQLEIFWFHIQKNSKINIDTKYLYWKWCIHLADNFNRGDWICVFSETFFIICMYLKKQDTLQINSASLTVNHGSSTEILETKIGFQIYKDIYCILKWITV